MAGRRVGRPGLPRGPALRTRPPHHARRSPSQRFIGTIIRLFHRLPQSATQAPPPRRSCQRQPTLPGDEPRELSAAPTAGHGPASSAPRAAALLHGAPPFGGGCVPAVGTGPVHPPAQAPSSSLLSYIPAPALPPEPGLAHFPPKHHPPALPPCHPAGLAGVLPPRPPTLHPPPVLPVPGLGDFSETHADLCQSDLWAPGEAHPGRRKKMAEPSFPQSDSVSTSDWPPGWDLTWSLKEPGPAGKPLLPPTGWGSAPPH